MQSRLAKLALGIGRECARQELVWMKHSQPDPAALLHMLDRRITGEPLQYILGRSGFLFLRSR